MRMETTVPEMTQMNNSATRRFSWFRPETKLKLPAHHTLASVTMGDMIMIG